MSIRNTPTLDWLCDNRDAIFDKMRWVAGEDVKKSDKARTDYFLRQSLRAHRRFGAAAKLQECGRGSYCGNVYCSTCRDRHAEHLRTRFNHRIYHEKLDDDGVLARFRWCTFLHAMVPADASWVIAAIGNARGFYNAFSAKFGRSWAQGAFECELVDLQKVYSQQSSGCGQERKRGLVLRLSGRLTDDLFADQDFTWEDADGNKRTDWVLVHTHFLMDVGDHDPDDMKAYIKARFSLDRQAIMESIWRPDVRSLDASLNKMASYPFKNRSSYNYNFGHYDEIGPEARFNANEMVTLFNIYGAMCKKNNKGHLLSWGVKGAWTGR